MAGDGPLIFLTAGESSGDAIGARLMADQTLAVFFDDRQLWALGIGRPGARY